MIENYFIYHEILFTPVNYTLIILTMTIPFLPILIIQKTYHFIYILWDRIEKQLIKWFSILVIEVEPFSSLESDNYTQKKDAIIRL